MEKICLPNGPKDLATELLNRFPGSRATFTFIKKNLNLRVILVSRNPRFNVKFKIKTIDISVKKKLNVETTGT